jgi:hypothetical protein
LATTTTCARAGAADASAAQAKAQASQTGRRLIRIPGIAMSTI